MKNKEEYRHLARPGKSCEMAVFLRLVQMLLYFFVMWNTQKRIKREINSENG